MSQHSSSPKNHLGTLYLLPVPIAESEMGHVLPAYNALVLGGLRHFIVENLRTARRFIRKSDPTFEIDSTVFYELNKHTEAQDISTFIEPLLQGKDVGLMSEAGCPGVADPGADVVAMAHLKGCRVVPLVGPSSILLSLMASGFNGQNFAFHGYLPITDIERAKKIKQLEQQAIKYRQTQIFIETPYRNQRLFQELLKLCAPRTRLCVAIGITSAQEDITTLTVEAWRAAKKELPKEPTVFLLCY